MLCRDCGFHVEDKTAVPNPFRVVDEADQAPSSNVEQKRPSLGEQMIARQEAKRKTKK